ncbi:MAG: DUF1573 domain-containing protein [bacterium]
MFRNLLIITFSLAIMSGCKNSKNPDVPENAINPAVIDNPASASTNNESKDNFPILQFEEERHDFGIIEQGEKISFAFKFKNVGKGDLVIRAAQASCGCTVPEYPKEPVKPGDSGVINVTFNSEGKEGMQEKTVTIISNTVPNNYILTITGNIKTIPE